LEKGEMAEAIIKPNKNTTRTSLRTYRKTKNRTSTIVLKILPVEISNVWCSAIDYNPNLRIYPNAPNSYHESPTTNGFIQIIWMGAFRFREDEVRASAIRMQHSEHLDAICGFGLWSEFYPAFP